MQNHSRRHRPLPPQNREMEQFEVKKVFKAGVIEQAVPEWGASVLFAPKRMENSAPAMNVSG